MVVILSYFQDLVTSYQHLLAQDYAWSAWTFAVTLLPGVINFIQGQFHSSQAFDLIWWLKAIPTFFLSSLFFQFIVVRDFYTSLFEPNDLAISLDKEEHKRVACNKYVDSVNKTTSMKHMEAFFMHYLSK